MIPAAGPALPLPSWAKIVTARVRVLLPDLRATRAGDRVRWTHGDHVVTTDVDGAIWWLHFAKPTGTSAPKHPAVYVGRHDEFTAHSVAGTMLAFFSAEHCTPASQPVP